MTFTSIVFALFITSAIFQVFGSWFYQIPDDNLEREKFWNENIGLLYIFGTNALIFFVSIILLLIMTVIKIFSGSI